MTTRRFGTSTRFRLLQVSELAGLPWCGCRERRLLTDDLGWARAGVRDWGLCGVALLSGHQVEGFALISPALYVPRGHPLARGANADAAALVALQLPQECPVGRQLLQGLAARLVDQRRIQALDAAGSETGGCLRPASSWLEESGFVPLADGLRYRLDLRATRSWLPSVSDVLRQVASVVRPLPAPAPAVRLRRAS
ncbi:MAG: hypothetical protein Q4G45_01785 [Actinomycetia bacterium]|nr:hypothetical protein [Actinomycetes bacterium]